MSIDEAIKLLQIEKMRVKHADVCNRECDKCALVQNTDGLLKMYTNVCELLKQLKEYQQLEELSRLVKLPCKVGDVVYVTEPTLVETMCVRIQLDGDRNGIWINAKEYPYDRWISFKAFGKTVFLTKAEAEARLKELECRLPARKE